MIELLVPQVFAIASMTAIIILFIVFSYKEYRLRKKIELLTHLIDKGYETENVDINNL